MPTETRQECIPLQTNGNNSNAQQEIDALETQHSKKREFRFFILQLPKIVQLSSNNSTFS